MPKFTPGMKVTVNEREVVVCHTEIEHDVPAEVVEWPELWSAAFDDAVCIQFEDGSTTVIDAQGLKKR